MHQPPKLFLRLFRWYCHLRLQDYIEGDLMEVYERRLKQSGKRNADVKFVIDVLLLFRPGIIRPPKDYKDLNTYGMYKSYFKIGWRNLLKNKAFSTINISGLAIGLAACLLILQFVTYQLSFDKFNEKLDRTYRVTNDRFQNGKLIQHGTIMYPTIGPAMAKDYPEIEEYTRLMPAGELNVIVGDKNFRGGTAFFTDEYFFSVFSFKMLAGDRSSMLKHDHSAVLSESMARKYFEFSGNDISTLIGKTFYWGRDQTPYEVKGICADIPDNSHIRFDALVSYATLIGFAEEADNSWTWSDMRHYLVLKPGVDYKELESKFDAFSERYFQGDKVSGSVEKFYLQPLKDAHLYSDYEYDIAQTANGKAVWAMLVVAIFILIIAWINYVNLTTSRALERAKEVGLRKVMGAFKSQLVGQFIFESLVISLMAFGLSIGIMSMFQDYFNQIVGSTLSWRILFEDITWRQIALITLTLIGGAFVAGFYPAFVLSSYMPVTALKGKFTRSARGNFLRKALVVFQFTSSAALIIGTFIVSRQIEFMRKADLGLTLKDVLVVKPPELTSYDSTFNERVEAYKDELMKVPGVVKASTSGRLPGDRLGRGFGFRLTDQSSEAHYTMSSVRADHGYLETMGVRLVAGRYLLPSDHFDNFDDVKSVVINVNAVKLFGLRSAEDAVGKEMFWDPREDRRFTIVGVVGDYHQESLQKPMEAIVFFPAYGNFSTSIRINTTERQQVISGVEEVYKKFFPGNSFEYFFLEDRYNNQYKDDTRFGKIVSIFTVLVIIVACLGLIGLSSYTAVLRTKEIGIRKVLGASVSNLVSILSADFVKLVLAASFLAVPIAYIAMNKWLEGYTYRITPNWILFVLPVLVILVISAFTISFQVLKTAMTNPVDTLKNE